MSLLSRLRYGDESTSPPEERIAQGLFVAALQEWGRGAITRADVVAAFNLTAGEQGQLDTLIAWYNASVDRQKFVDVLKLALRLYAREVVYVTENDLITRLQNARDGINT